MKLKYLNISEIYQTIIVDGRYEVRPKNKKSLSSDILDFIKSKYPNGSGIVYWWDHNKMEIADHKMEIIGGDFDHRDWYIDNINRINE